MPNAYCIFLSVFELAKFMQVQIIFDAENYDNTYTKKDITNMFQVRRSRCYILHIPLKAHPRFKCLEFINHLIQNNNANAVDV